MVSAWSSPRATRHFYHNCFKNGILPATLPKSRSKKLFKRTEKEEGYSLTVIVPNQTVATNAA